MDGKLGGIAAKMEFLDELKGKLQARRGLLAEPTFQRAGDCPGDSLRAAGEEKSRVLCNRRTGGGVCMSPSG